jgi:hypothetical protein
MDDWQYFLHELLKARPPLGVEDEGYRLKVTGYLDKGSRWLSLTPEQFDKVFALMTREDF